MFAVYVDTDVIISSLISSNGAAYILLEKTKESFMISNLSEEEVLKVAKRLKISEIKTRNLLKKLNKVKINKTEDFKKYILDPNDSHIVAGAVTAKAKYLITYNTRHFLADKIKDELGIILMTPALFLQYLRSQR